ncbi:MAG: hypothetical protein A2Y70_00835 [Candidatus Aminicenantes bacterium RBG_13_64_14]|nr:MAG: hypothetical protein A2Y70_00835 [Candidatus Aminicenantes bacterium RBG_13_64_14]
MTESASQAMAILRDGSQFQWYVVVLLAFVFYVYTVEVEKRNWSLVLAGLAFWGMDWFNEIWNGLVMHFTGYAPVWGAPGKTAYLILIGLNIEIMFMFAVSGIIWTKMLLPDKKTRILGLPNRWVVAIAGSAFCVFVEYLLNGVGALTWDYSWWSRSAPWLIFLIGYLTFFVVAFWVHDVKTLKAKLITVGTIWAVVIASLILFIPVLHWI